MTRISSNRPSRRSVLAGGGALVVSSFALPEAIGRAVAQNAAKPPLLPTELDSFIAVGADGTVTAFFGKMDVGHGLATAVAQIVADELDVRFERVKVVMADTATTVDQGGASGSTGVQEGGKPLRNAAAEARRVLIAKAAETLGVPADELVVRDGIVQPKSGGRKVSYAQLIGGRYFNVTLDWNKKYGNPLDVEGKAKPKPPSEYRVVGRSPCDVLVHDKVFGKTEYASDVRRPRMLHARMIRPPVAGNVPVSADSDSIAHIPGARVVQVKDLIAVVAEDEWDAVKAAQALKVHWSGDDAPFPDQVTLYDHLRTAPTVFSNAGNIFAGRRPVDEGPIDAALAKAARVIEREYEYPLQSHSSMGPGCAVVETGDGKATVWTGTQKAHAAQKGVAAILGLPLESVHAIWQPGPGSYGRNDAGDAALDAAVLAKATGRPVRVQYMRHEGTGWDPKGPAGVLQMKAGIDADGNVVAYRFKARGFSSFEMMPSEADPSDTLAGMLTGFPIKGRDNYGVPGNNYEFPAQYAFWETVAPLLKGASPLRTAHLRDPQGPQCQFGSESFMDELASELRVDPVEFRLRYLKSPRDIAAIKAAAEKAGWQTRTGPRHARRGEKLVGQGIGYSVRSGTIVVTVAEIEIDPLSGRIWPRRFTVAHDCGLIINPTLLKKTIEGNIVQAASRTLVEEVKFDTRNVTSNDWTTYPVLEIEDVPEAIDIVLLDHPEVAPSGAGEAATSQVGPAIANAIFDATGKRARRIPFTRDAIKALLT